MMIFFSWDMPFYDLILVLRDHPLLHFPRLLSRCKKLRGGRLVIAMELSDVRRKVPLDASKSGFAK